MTPSDGARSVKGTAQLKITFSSPIAADSPRPSLVPPEAGTWRAHGRQLIFEPSMPYLPLSHVRLVIPAGPSGIRATDGARLAEGAVERFAISDGSMERLQQLLSLLDYSPLAFSSTGSAIPAADAKGQRVALFDPPAGTFAWRSHGWPVQLTSLWHVGRYDVMTRGLVMEFQADHGLTPNGRTSTALWQSLLSALASGERNTGGYNYALGDQHQPESLSVWHNGRRVLHVPANTGIAQAPTTDGNFNVFARYRSQVMRGTNPGGSKYADPVQYVAYFDGGEAVHYIARANYGIPQSLGCIELNLQDAAKAWPYLAYGTIVTVIG